MKKIITSTFLAAVMALSLVACGNTVSDILDGNNDTTTTSEATTSEATTSDETTTSDDMTSSESSDITSSDMESSSDMDSSSEAGTDDGMIDSSEADEVESALSTIDDFVNDQLDDATSEG